MDIIVLDNRAHDFDKMSLLEKKNILSGIFERQRRLVEQNLSGFMLRIFLNELNDIYSKHRDDILQQLQGKKTDKDILNIILAYF